MKKIIIIIGSIILISFDLAALKVHLTYGLNHIGPFVSAEHGTYIESVQFGVWDWVLMAVYISLHPVTAILAWRTWRKPSEKNES